MKIKKVVKASKDIQADDYTKVKGLNWLAQDASILCDVCNAKDDELVDTLYNYPSLKSIAQEEGRPGVIKKLVDMINVYAKGCNYGSIATVYSSLDIDDETEAVDDYDADLYVVKIWYETDPGHDSLGPEAAEEIIETYATSPDEALEYAKRAWSGPIDRIEIVDVNPLPDVDDLLPYDEY